MGQSFTVNGKTNLYFVNLSPTNENINLGCLSASYSVLQYASTPANFVTGNSSIPASSSTVTNTLYVPAYSVTSLLARPSQSGNGSPKALLAVLAGAILICTIPMALLARRRRRHAYGSYLSSQKTA
jgi:hypothetical protein